MFEAFAIRDLNRRLLPAGRMLVSVEDFASLHPPQAALRLRPPWTPARDTADDGNQTICACYGYVARRVPGRKKSEKNPREKINFLPRAFFAF